MYDTIGNKMSKNTKMMDSNYRPLVSKYPLFQVIYTLAPLQLDMKYHCVRFHTTLSTLKNTILCSSTFYCFPNCSSQYQELLLACLSQICKGISPISLFHRDHSFDLYALFPFLTIVQTSLFRTRSVLFVNLGLDCL